MQTVLLLVMLPDDVTTAELDTLDDDDLNAESERVTVLLIDGLPDGEDCTDKLRDTDADPDRVLAIAVPEL